MIINTLRKGKFQKFVLEKNLLIKKYYIIIILELMEFIRKIYIFI